MRDPITIGRYHSAPPRRVLRSLNSGYRDWQSWAGTPRQIRRLADVAPRDPEGSWLFRAVMLVGFGFVAGMLMAGVMP